MSYFVELMELNYFSSRISLKVLSKQPRPVAVHPSSSYLPSYLFFRLVDGKVVRGRGIVFCEKLQGAFIWYCVKSVHYLDHVNLLRRENLLFSRKKFPGASKCSWRTNGQWTFYASSMVITYSKSTYTGKSIVLRYCGTVWSLILRCKEKRLSSIFPKKLR